MKLIDNIEYLCNENNISISKMLADLGLARGLVSNWRKRGTIPSGDIVLKIANYFDVSTDFLLGIEEFSVHPDVVTSSYVANKIKELRQQREMSLFDVAKVLGINQYQYTLIEHGEMPLVEEQKKVLCEFYNIPFSELSEKTVPQERPLTKKQEQVLNLAKNLSDEDMKKLIDYAELLMKAKNQ